MAIKTIWILSGLLKAALVFVAVVSVSIGLSIHRDREMLDAIWIGLLLGFPIGVIATIVLPCWRFEWR